MKDKTKEQLIKESKKLKKRITELEKAEREWKKTEKELRESEKKYKLLFDSALDGIVVIDAETMKVVLVNQSALEMYGYSSMDEIGELSPFDFIPLEDRDRVLKIIAKDMFEKDLQEVNEFRTITKDGKEIWISAVGARTEYRGKLAGLVSFRDITEHKRAEQVQSVLNSIANAANTTKDLNELFKLIHSHLGKIIDTTNIYVALYDKETGTISLPYMADEKKVFTSFPSGKTLTDYVIRTGKSLLADEKVLERLSQAGEAEAIGPPSKIWLGVPLKIANEVIGVVVVQSYTDASLYTEKDVKILEFVSDEIATAIQRKRAEDALRKSEALKSSVLSSVPHAVIGLRERYIIFANRGVETVFGWKPKELIGKTTRVLYRSDKEYEEIAKHFYPALERQQTYSEEFPCRRKDGRDIMCMVSASRIGERLKERKIVITYEDITERKRMEKELKKRLGELEIYYNVSMGREKRIIELKHKVNELLEQLGKEKKYGV
jgi:PAS domain S-box-containing protein